MPEPATWYDVLGVSGGASAVTLRRAYEERVLLLRCYLTAEALTAPALTPPAPAPGQTAPIALAEAPGPVAHAARAAAAVEEAWLVLGDPGQRRRYDARLRPPLTIPAGRKRVVPDLRGLFYRSGQSVAATVGLRLAMVRLTPNPLPVEGLVVGQTPNPGETVRRRSTLTVQVWHPTRDR